MDLAVGHDGVKWNPHVLIEKWSASQTARVAMLSGVREPKARHFYTYGVKPVEIVESDGNLLTTAGLTRLTNLLTGGGGQALTNTSCRIGVGNGTGTAAVGDTDLSASAGSSNRWFQIMDATYPSASGAVITWKSTFGTADGNFAWNEWGIDISAPTVASGNTVGTTLFNHKTSAALGTKSAGTSWAFTVTVTFS